MPSRTYMTAAVSCLACVTFASAQAPTDHRDLIVEGITTEGDIYGWTKCREEEDDPNCDASIATAFVFVVQSDGTYAYYDLPGVENRALGAARDSSGRLMVCGIEMGRSDVVADGPIAWLLDGSQHGDPQVLSALEGDDFLSIQVDDFGGSDRQGLLSAVVADESDPTNPQWILVGEDLGVIGDTPVPKGAMTLRIPFGSELPDCPPENLQPKQNPQSNCRSDDIDLSYQADWSMSFADINRVKVITSGCVSDEVKGSASVAWCLTESPERGRFHVGGASWVRCLDGSCESVTNSLGFLDLIGGVQDSDYLIPSDNLEHFVLVEPDDWLCVEDYNNTEDNPSVSKARVFDVVQNGQGVGSLNTLDSQRSYGFISQKIQNQDQTTRWMIQRLYGLDSAGEDPRNDTAALASAEFADGSLRIVGMERYDDSTSVSSLPNVFAYGRDCENTNAPGLDRLDSVQRDHDRALEWVFQDNGDTGPVSYVVSDLNDRIESRYPGVQLLNATDINSNGWITGLAYRSKSNVGLDDAFYFGFLLTSGADGVPGGGDDQLIDLDQLRFDVDHTEYCYGDFNRDGSVNGGDFGNLLAAWSTNSAEPDYCLRLDMDCNGLIDGADLGAFLASWGSCFE